MQCKFVLPIMSENLFCCFCLKVISSDTSGSESKSESDWSESCCSDDEDPEEWHEEVDDLLEDKKLWLMMNLCQNQSDIDLLHRH